jgi:hypothetical protein
MKGKRVIGYKEPHMYTDVDVYVHTVYLLVAMRHSCFYIFAAKTVMAAADIALLA